MRHQGHEQCKENKVDASKITFHVLNDTYQSRRQALNIANMSKAYTGYEKLVSRIHKEL